MRVCQICGHNGKRVIQNDYDDQPMCLFECTQCGHWYVDGLKLSQEWFDDYYLTKYTTDDKPYSDARLNSLADAVAKLLEGIPITNVADIGGADGELVLRLRERGIMAWAYGVGDEQSKQWHADAVILSHTLEHIYDIGAMMERVKLALKPGGFLFIEVPIHMGYSLDYDRHWQHVNKFRPIDLRTFLEEQSFKLLKSMKLPDYREYKCWRIVGQL